MVITQLHFNKRVIAFTAVLFLMAVILPVMRPITAFADPPVQPTNISPADGTTDIGLTHTFRSSAFSDPDPEPSHHASRWQVARDALFTDLAFDSGVDNQNKVTITMTSGILSYGTTYYWHVRHQDETGEWSPWSTATSFTTIATLKPNQPSNVSPANNATDVTLTPTLSSSAFSDADAGDTHTASQWQITTTPGDYASPAYDSGVTTSFKLSINVPTGRLILDTTYHWRVRHRDSYNNWSDYSVETSFTTRASVAPNRPTAASPANESVNISLEAQLSASQFADADTADTSDSHTASQWQVATDSDFTDIVFDSDVDTSNLRTVDIPEDTLTYNTIYYWRVRYRDSYDVWSQWSTAVSFTTMSARTDFTANTTEIIPGVAIIFTDTSVGNITSWTWNFGDGTPVVVWDVDSRPAPGMLLHTYSSAGNYTVTLTTNGPDGEIIRTKNAYISVTAASSSGLLLGLPLWTWIVIGVVILGAGIGLWWYQRQKAVL